MKRKLAVLLGTSEPAVVDSLKIVISHSLREGYNLSFTIEEQLDEVRTITAALEFGLVVLFVNTMYFGGLPIGFDRVVELVRAIKRKGQTVVVVVTTCRPRGFAMAVEQAGVDVILDAPFSAKLMGELVKSTLATRQPE